MAFWVGEKRASPYRGTAWRASSLALLLGSVGAATPARAEDQTWACEVMLCASNPGGWMQFGECVAPIQKLITHLALGGAFPVCVSGGTSSAKYIRPRNGIAHVVFTMSDGARVTYTVPTQVDINRATTAGSPAQ